MQNFQDKTYKVGDVRINYIEGPQNKIPLVLLAGQALSIDSYQRVFDKLSEKYHVYAIDLRGHGKSSWTTGKYNIPNMGEDIGEFIREIIKKPTFVSGNSSGGLVALWLAANHPADILGIVLEDVPLFSSEWPRLKNTWVYSTFVWNAKTIGNQNGRQLGDFLSRIEVPDEGKGKVIAFPSWIGLIIGIAVKMHQKLNPSKPVDLFFMPPMVRLLTKSLSVYDPDVTKACVRGEFCEGFDHSEALRNTKCPILLLHANWFETEKHGLIGSMNDEDVELARKLAPQIQYQKVTSGHMIHFEQPTEYLQYVTSFIDGK